MKKKRSQIQETLAVEVYDPKPPRKLKDFRTPSKRAGLQATGQGKGRLLSPGNIVKMERRYRAVELRKQGFLLREIAVELRVDEGTVSADLRAVLANLVEQAQGTTEEQRVLALERLDGMLKAYYAIATEPLITNDGQIIPMNMAAAQLVLQIEARKAKLLALDTPESKADPQTGVRQYVGVDTDLV